MRDGTTDFVESISGKLAGLTTAAEESLSWKPGRVIYVASGAQVAWDDCCDGQLWARLVTLVPGEPAGGRGARPGGVCGLTHFFATVELGVVRCAAVVDDRGTAPTPAVLTSEGLSGIEDMGALLEAALCFSGTRAVERWTPVGPQGGCVGGYWTLSMRIENCVECE